MKEYIWKCEVCNKILRTKHELYAHKKLENHYLINNSKFNNVKADIELRYICQYCGKEFTTKNGKSLHEKSCNLNPNRIPGARHPVSEETKKKISLLRKEYIKEHGGVWWNSRSTCKRSYAEEWVLKILNNEVQDKEFVEEFHLNKWFMDFAWPKKKIYIEIDGQQHEWEDRKERDKEKDDYYRSLGWKCLRLPWSYCCSNSQECVKKIIDFVDNSKIVDINWKSKKEIYEEKLEEAKKLGKINSLGYISANKVSIDEFNRRKSLILESGIDISRYGWISKVSKITGLSRKQIRDTSNYFNLDSFCRKEFQ